MNHPYEQWKEEERLAHIRGWDFSHISGRYEEEKQLPWDYRGMILKHLREEDRLLDIDTGILDRFAYLPFGATHAPHQAPPSYLAKYRGRFDEGWDVARERWFRRQIETGVIPADTELAPRNPGVEPWDSLTENQKRFAARLQEAFAAFLDHTDDQIGRLVDGLRNRGLLDDTVLVVLADNGASQEGGAQGTFHEMKYFNLIDEDPDEAVERLDDIGGPNSHTNYPWGWAQCGNAPFRWYKQNTHEGGVHVPMVVHWPNGIDFGQQGTKRSQFVNVADIVPDLWHHQPRRDCLRRVRPRPVRRRSGWLRHGWPGPGRVRSQTGFHHRSRPSIVAVGS